ncbi:ferredoxin--NADP reductase [Neopusillimonas maritima]|uniref:ferredoxin--NADP(+) reductase n=1 Tax=Neopusillimonas maritima TaxID=2026239 RepID=A0A3A1YQK1_9BURK|nr:ferredoxin--NADP reductase [Neopusillimonas maritima]RIY39220.1 ferredoxin--NADP(+) reductase [Neopusillimonas maritima]
MSDSKYTRETVLKVHAWVPDKLLSLTTTRDASYEFTAGQFARLGLPASHAPNQAPSIWRAYSMVTPPLQSDTLEFYSIVVPQGEFSPRLAGLQPGDALYVDRTAFGFLTLDRFPAGGDLWLLATGTGLSAYLSMLQDPATWASYDRIILVHGVRTVQELAYRERILQWVNSGLPEASELPRCAQLVYLPIPTREAFESMPMARLTHLIQDGRLESLAGCTLHAETSKVMLCGNPDMLTEARQILKTRGFAVGRRGNPGNLALENYW